MGDSAFVFQITYSVLSFAALMLAFYCGQLLYDVHWDHLGFQSDVDGASKFGL